MTEILPLIAEHDARDGQVLELGGEIGNHELGLEGPHLAGFVFAREELQSVGAGREGEARVVGEGAFGERAGALALELDFLVIAHVALHDAFGIADFADEIELGAVGALAVGEFEFASPGF